MKRIIVSVVAGMRTGSLFYLVVFLASHVWSGLAYPSLNAPNILAVLIMSGIIGGLTLLFDELDQLAHAVLIGIHFLCSAVVVSVTSLWMGWGNILKTPLIWILFLIIYGLVWLYQVQIQHRQTQRINQALKNRQLNRKNTKEV